MKYALTIVMPAYNEEGCIEKVVRSWHEEVIKKLTPSRMVVVNDGSKDKTGEILDRLALQYPDLTVVHQSNSGHGAALRNAYNNAEDTEWVFQVDSDDQFLPSDFWKLWDRRGENVFLTGYRKERFDAFHRLVITRALRLVLLLLFGCYCRDSNIPFRLIKGETLSKYLALIPGGVFIPNIFITVIAQKSGVKLLEIPVTHKERRTGKVSIMRFKLMKALFRCLGELIAFRRSLAKADMNKIREVQK